jgi:hypothetical protein
VYEELWKAQTTTATEKASVEQLTNVVESLGLNSKKTPSTFGPSNPGNDIVVPRTIIALVT